MVLIVQCGGKRKEIHFIDGILSEEPVNIFNAAVSCATQYAI